MLEKLNNGVVFQMMHFEEWVIQTGKKEHWIVSLSQLVGERANGSLAEE